MRVVLCALQAEELESQERARKLLAAGGVGPPVEVRPSKIDGCITVWQILRLKPGGADHTAFF